MGVFDSIKRNAIKFSHSSESVIIFYRVNNKSDERSSLLLFYFRVHYAIKDLFQNKTFLVFLIARNSDF